MGDCTRKKTFCQVCGYRRCMMQGPSPKILHCNPPLHTMSRESQAAAQQMDRMPVPPLNQGAGHGPGEE